jgi:hypothetical protein
MTDRLLKLEQELTAMKRSTRRWRGATTLLLVGAGLLAADAVGPTVIDHLVVRKLDVITEDGHSVLSLAQTETGGQLDLYAADGTNLLRLGTNESGGDLAVWNREGTSTIGLWSSDEGGVFSLWNAEGVQNARVSSGALTLKGSLAVENSSGVPVFVVASDDAGDGRMQLVDHEGNMVCEIRTIPGLGGALVLKTVEGKRVVLLSATDHGGSFNLMNTRGVPVVLASTSSNHGGAITVANERGMGVVTTQADNEHRGAVNVSDEDGNGTRRIRPLRGYSP